MHRIQKFTMQGQSTDSKLWKEQMESRVTKLETAVEYIQRDVELLQRDVRALRQDMIGIRTTDFRLLFGAIIAAAVGLTGLIAKGFNWL